MSYKDVEKRRAYRRKIYKENKEAFNKLKDVPCKDCNQNFPHYVMDFDHARGIKKVSIGHLGQGKPSARYAQEELEKCDVVCANCHKIRTHVRRQLSQL